MPLQIICNDITTMHVDAIVNAANVHLAQEGCVCGAIFAVAGAYELRAECARIGDCSIGEAVVTKGYGLPEKYIIHTVGPVWQDGKHGEEALQRFCYTSSLELAKVNDFESITFPLISSGTFGYPKDLALSVQFQKSDRFLLKNELDVFLVIYSSESYKLSKRLFHSISEYIDNNYVDSHWIISDRAEEEGLWSLRQVRMPIVLVPKHTKLG